MNQQMSTKFEMITPESAADYLSRNTSNRRIRHVVVNRYAATMMRDGWEENGESIKLSLDGRLLDGQHRLKAIIQANRAVRLLVVRGLDNSAMFTIDSGIIRNTADTIAITTGYTQSTSLMLSSAIKLLMHYENSPNWLQVYNAAHANYTVDNPAVNEYHRQHTHELAANMKFLKETLPATGCVLSSAERLFFYTIFNRKDPELAKQFVMTIFKGVNVQPDSTEYFLRDFVQRIKNKSLKQPVSKVRHSVIKGWNRMRSGKPIKSTNGLAITDKDPIHAQ